MKRLLQFAAVMLILAALLAPLVELFDCWDAPGPSNDTELASFGVILVLCLVLLVCKLIAALAGRIRGPALVAMVWPYRGSRLRIARVLLCLVAPQGSPPPLPLRI